YSLLFFFQAEDGIRDRNVTGVQTCALPIFFKIWSMASTDASAASPQPSKAAITHGSRNGALSASTPIAYDLTAAGSHGHAMAYRSEERRVGKGGWLGRWAQ